MGFHWWVGYGSHQCTWNNVMMTKGELLLLQAIQNKMMRTILGITD